MPFIYRRATSLVFVVCLSCVSGLRMLPSQNLPLVRHFCWNQDTQSYQFVFFEECHPFSPKSRSILCWDQTSGTFHIPYGNLCPVTTDEARSPKSDSESFGATSGVDRFKAGKSYKVWKLPQRPELSRGVGESDAGRSKVAVIMPLSVTLNAKDPAKTSGESLASSENVRHRNCDSRQSDQLASGSSNDFRRPYQRSEYKSPAYRMVYDNSGNYLKGPALQSVANYRPSPAVRYYGRYVNENAYRNGYQLPHEVTYDHTVNPVHRYMSYYNGIGSQTPPFKVQIQ